MKNVMAMWNYNLEQNIDKVYVVAYDEKSKKATAYWGYRKSNAWIGFNQWIDVPRENYLKIINAKMGKGYKEIMDGNILKGISQKLDSENVDAFNEVYGI